MQTSAARRPLGTAASPGHAILAGLSASLVGIGLARFAYTPLLPALIGQHWFLPAAADYLGAANLGGYLVGALIARALAQRIGARSALRLMMALATASLFACALRLGFPWFFAWRLLSGVAGGVLMVLTAPTVLPHVPPARRGIAAGAIFTGVGLGIAASGTLVPLLMREGLVATWLGLGVSALALTALAWGGWPVAAATATPAAATPAAPARGRAVLKALYVEYALNAVGLVPHMVFLVDFVARGLGRGLAEGSFCWILFGAGAVAGPIVFGHLADRIGFARMLRWGVAIEAALVVLPAVATGRAALFLSSVVVGAFVPGIVTLTLGRAHELLPRDPAGRVVAWRRCTIAFAIGQAIAAYGFSYLYQRSGGDFVPLFALGAAALILAVGIDVAVARRLPAPDFG
jgi:predicted MFS family arabinose efflux permease